MNYFLFSSPARKGGVVDLLLFCFYFSISLNLAFDSINDLLDQTFFVVPAYIATQQGPVKENLLLSYLIDIQMAHHYFH
jgi:hypothetical protein